MKQLLIIFITILFGVNNIQAQETKPYEETTWNVIRERLFGENHSKAFRFEKDIRIELKGDVTRRDSSIVETLIAELKPLLQIVEIKLVEKDANFIIDMLPAGSSIKQKTNYHHKGEEITFTHLWFSFNENTLDTKVEEEIRYYVIRHLTRTFEPRLGATYYGGIFDQPFPKMMPFHIIDKDLLTKLYSKDFYKNLRKNTVKKWSLLFYIKLRYENLLNNISIAFLVILTIWAFLRLLSNNRKTNNKKTVWRHIKKNIIVLFVIAFAFSSWSTTSLFHISTGTEILLNFIRTFSGILLFAFFSLLVSFFIEYHVFKRIPNFLQKQLFIFFNTIFSVVIVFILASIPFFIFGTSQKTGILGFAVIMNTPILFFVVSVSSLRVFYNFINYRIQSMVNQKDVELAKMKELKNQAELNALHSRINPHFLYNSLNSIAGLAHINADKTENMATGLSELFRYSINKENKTFVTVSEELEMVEKYLEIEKTRFEDRLIYTIEAEETVKQKKIPKFLIQPLAENAIKHGLSKIKGVGKITISVKQHEKDLVITIFDNGPDFPEEPVSGYGLQNLNDKLEIIYGNDAFINWENGENKHFQITIKDKFTA